MKLLDFLSIPMIFLVSLSLHAQDRGMQPVQVSIDGTTTTLYQQSHALIIGVSAYNAGLPPLPGVTEDINLVKSALEGSGFDVVTVMNPDNNGLQRAFTSFIAQYGQGLNNRLFIYYAGHGYTEKMPYGDDIGYICPADTPDPNKNPAGFQEKALPMRQIETYAYQIKSKHALFMFDACFSGSIFSTSRAIPEVINYKTKEPVRQFITSGSANETVPDKSIFMGQFLRALQGEADGNNDGYLTGTELGEFLQSTVVNYSYGSQHPQYGKIRNPNLDKGDFVFVLNATGQQSSVVSQQSGQTQQDNGIAVAETNLVKYGGLEINTEIGGELYIDNSFVKNVNSNTLVTLINIPEGHHTIMIKGEEVADKEVEVEAARTCKVTIEKKRVSWSCGNNLTVIHTTGEVAPVTKTIAYGTAESDLTGSKKCWITQNLGSAYQAMSTTENTESAAGWYWQFNRKQGYKHDGTNRTPNSSWILINENSNWAAANDPCTIELGNGWRLPAFTEWENIIASNGWKKWNDPWNSSLKIHAAGYLHASYGNLKSRGSYGYYWSGTQFSNVSGGSLELYKGNCNVATKTPKSYGFSVRCLKD